MNEKFLKTIEEDQERDMRTLEDSIRQEVSRFHSNSLESFLFSGTTKIRTRTRVNPPTYIERNK